MSSHKQAFLLLQQHASPTMRLRGYLSGNNLFNSLFPRSIALFSEIANKVTTSVNCDCVYYKTEVAASD